MDRVQKVNAGDKIRIHHETWNEVVAATVAARKGGATGGPMDLYVSREYIRVRNNTGSALPFGAIVALNDPLIDPADNEGQFLKRVAFGVGTPGASTDVKFAVLIEPIPAGVIGRAVCDGTAICLVRYDGVSAKDYAEVRSGSTVSLDNVAVGTAAVLWMADSGDVNNDRWAVVRLDGGNVEAVTFLDSTNDDTLSLTHLRADEFGDAPFVGTAYGPNVYLWNDGLNPGWCYVGQSKASYETAGYVTGYASDDPTQVIGGWKIFGNGIMFGDNPSFPGTPIELAMWGRDGSRYFGNMGQSLFIGYPFSGEQYYVEMLYNGVLGAVFMLDPDGDFGSVTSENARYGVGGNFGIYGTLIDGSTVSGGIITGAGSSTLSVSAGGTGVSTIPQYAVVIGAGTGAVQTAAPGTAGEVLMSNGAAANPSFQAITDAHISGGIDCGTW